MMSDWPDQLTINAWADAPVDGPVGPDARRWILHQDVEAKAHDADQTLAARPDRPADWSDPEVGWGVVLPNSDLPVSDQARLADAPAAILRLAEARAGPDGPAVFRWAPQNGYTSLLRVYQNGDHQPTAITGGVAGSGPGRRPKYLLLVGPPAALPWELQCRLNLSCAVGRLDLPDEALERYVDALLCDWNGADIDATRPVIWATDYDNITGIMRDAIAEPVAAKFRDDPQVRDGFSFLSEDAATADRLVRVLRETCPAVVVTTSHGRTGPLGDAAAMRRDLGLPIDADRRLLEPAALLDGWQPDGAVWYAHACCSAGSDGTTRYTGLVRDGSRVARVLNEVAALGPLVSPLPTALLSAEKPARAFIGHVEPTFDWTMERPRTGQLLTAAILRAIWTGFFQPEPEPVGLAFREHFREAAELFGESAQTNRNSRENSRERQAASLALLTAYDRQSTVILGDPTVCPAALPLSSRPT